MKTAHALVAFIALLFLAPLAQAATATITWSAPTAATDGTALTGAQVITAYQVWLSTTTIPVSSTATPTATVTGTATTTTQTITVAPGATIFARVKACNSAGCSVFSSETSKVLPLTTPNPPTNLTVTIVVEP